MTAKRNILLTGLPFIGIMIAIYILQINSLTGVLYKIGEYETRITQLKEETNLLEANNFQIISRKNMEELAYLLNFEKVDQITYIKMLEGTVAQTTRQQ